MRLSSIRFLFAALAVTATATSFAQDSSRATSSDVVVYGGTSGGVIAAVQAKRMGRSVVIVCPDQHLGGLSSGGLGWTDTGNKAVIGGLAREFCMGGVLTQFKMRLWGSSTNFLLAPSSNSL